MVNIIDICTILDVEILRQCVGKPLPGFGVLLIVVLPAFQPFQSPKFPCWGCVPVESEVWVGGEKLECVRLELRAVRRDGARDEGRDT